MVSKRTKKIIEELSKNLEQCKNERSSLEKQVLELKDEVKQITKAAIEGKLDTRGKTDKFHGDFAEIVTDVNNTLDAVIGPLNVASEYIDRISKGDIPEKITNTYNGDLKKVKNNLNFLIDETNMITENAKLLAKGDLTVELQKRSENDELMQALSEMTENLRNIVSSINSGAENIANGAR